MPSESQSVYRISMEEAGEELRRLVQRVLAGEELVITRDKRPIAKVIPMQQGPRRPMFGSARGLVEMADDFDAPLPDFQDYTG